MSAHELSANAVAEYLAAHPDFFSHNMQLLEHLYVPHQTGRAVSLVERQTSVLREKNTSLRTHLADLIDIARHNDTQFEKTKRMVLALLDAVSFEDLADALDESLCRDFHSDTTALLLFGEPFDRGNVRRLPRETVTPVESLLESNLPSCGQLPDTQRYFLFAEEAVKVQSAAVVPLVKGETLGLLAIGSYDPHYFQSSQGTLFLSYVGEVLSRVVNRILHQSRY